MQSFTTNQMPHLCFQFFQVNKILFYVNDCMSAKNSLCRENPPYLTHPSFTVKPYFCQTFQTFLHVKPRYKYKIHNKMFLAEDLSHTVLLYVDQKRH